MADISVKVSAFDIREIEIKTISGSGLQWVFVYVGGELVLSVHGPDNTLPVVKITAEPGLPKVEVQHPSRNAETTESSAPLQEAVEYLQEPSDDQ